MSEIRKMRGPDTPRSSVKIPKLEDQKEVVAALIALGMEIGKVIENSQKK